uniref:2-cysteine adaptor domain n=1 Tax=Spizellomyces sp. 'palustris' TaxID=117820 RepID=UPI0010FBEB0E|nr:2-cysteine adaptor domain [Spizellomyces sp. 'palustris']QCQ69048.1 2-cysteine adaptor domain [Spizellomyces sp. 'palustris']
MSSMSTPPYYSPGLFRLRKKKSGLWAKPISFTSVVKQEVPNVPNKIINPLTNRQIVKDGPIHKMLIDTKLLDQHGNPIKENVETYNTIKFNSNATHKDMSTFCTIMSLYKNLRNHQLRMELLNQMTSMYDQKDAEIANDIAELNEMINGYL